MRRDQSVLSPFGLLIAIGISSAVAEFRVHTSETPVTATYSQSTVLGCSFTVQDESSLKGLVISWERVETEEVVYSYYYGKEQLSHQGPRYSGRTSLFLEELKHGNASVKLERVRPEDIGQYKCFVSNTKGNDQDTVSLIFAAYYKEPNFFIQLKPSGTLFRFESQGYPKAFVSWYNEENDISTLSETFYQQNGDGLYSLQSILEISDDNRSPNYTFRLRNDVLHQSISRTFGLSIEMKTPEAHKINQWSLTILLLVIEFLICLILGAVYMKHVQQKIRENQNGYSNS
ncbi:CD276 antigen-like isoform X2 [Carcharodon carcharias]|nr:CD276 antigen-like isoform X2 [Carcharodon carcharias]